MKKANKLRFLVSFYLNLLWLFLYFIVFLSLMALVKYQFTYQSETFKISTWIFSHACMSENIYLKF